MTSDLAQRLRELSMCKHDDHNLLAEAADRIEQLQREKDYAEFCLRERTEHLNAYKKRYG